MTNLVVTMYSMVEKHLPSPVKFKRTVKTVKVMGTNSGALLLISCCMEGRLQLPIE
jgi:hypothetical protein